jgi:adenylate cyclase
MQQLNLFHDSVSRVRRTNRYRKQDSKKMLSASLSLWTQDAQQERDLALFFLDIRNFTPLVEKHQATDVIYIVRKLFSTFQNIIRIHHGRIIETTGDGFYAAFGFEVNVKEAAKAAVHAGMKILQTLEKLNTESFEKNLGQRIDVGIGVHVGKVATGSLHLNTEDHLVVMGLPVNVASRLQSATKELNNNFIVSSDVVNILKDTLSYSHSVMLSLKGVSGMCEAYPIGQVYTPAVA